MVTDFDPLMDAMLGTLKAVDVRLSERLTRLEAREALMPRDGRDGAPGAPGERGEPGLAGKDGRDGLDGKDGAPGLNGKDGAAGRDGLDGKDGAPGLNGKDADPTVLHQLTAQLETVTRELADLRAYFTKSLAELPVPRDGKDGRDGLDGKDGEKGLDGLHGRDGRDGLPGVPGPPGEKGMDGKDGVNGRDGADGLHGKDGQDGVGFDDMDVVFDKDTGVRIRFVRGEVVKEFPLPVPYDAGVWRPGVAYPEGAFTTKDGGIWSAQTRTFGKPGESPDWRLAVKRGRDGKDGKDGRG